MPPSKRHKKLIDAIEERSAYRDNAELKDFRSCLFDILSRSKDNDSILFCQVDAIAHALIVPKSFNYSLTECQQIAKELQHSILPNKYPGKRFFIVEWPSVGEISYPLSPNIDPWYHTHYQWLEGKTRLVFFMDAVVLKESAQKAIAACGYHQKSVDDKNVLLISCRDFEISINIIDLAASSLFRAENSDGFIKSYMAQLEDIFQSYEELLAALKIRHPNAYFWKENGKLFAKNDKKMGTIDYQRLVKAAKTEQVSIDVLLQQATLSDLMLNISHISLSLRSDIFIKAWPQTLAEKTPQGPLCVVQQERSNHLRPIAIIAKQHKNRISYFKTVASLSIHTRHYNIRAIVHDRDGHFGIALLGDKIASIALYPHLVKGVLREFTCPNRNVFISARFEDILVISNMDTPSSITQQLLKRGETLLRHFVDDGSDPMNLNFPMNLPAFGCGHFAIRHVPSVFFDLLDTAINPALNLPQARRDYLHGLAFEMIREWPLAVKNFKNAYRRDINDPDISHALGRAMTEDGQSKNAIVFLKRALMEYPDDPEILNTLGKSYLASGYHEDAIEVLERAVNIVPDDVFYLASLGKSYFASQRLQEAEDILTRALSVMPDFPDAHSILAQIRWREGNLNAAKKHARKAFAADPGNKHAQELLWALSMDDED